MSESTEHRPAQGAPSLEEYHKVRQAHLYETASFRYRSAGDFAQVGLKSALVANGGALIASLTFLGNAQTTYGGPGLFVSFAAFVVGLICALVAVLCAYETQAAYGLQESAGADKIYFHLISDVENAQEQDQEESKQMARGAKWEVGAISTYVASIVMFLLGAVAGLLTLAA